MISIDTSGLLIFNSQMNALFDKMEANLTLTVGKTADLIVQGIKNNWKGEKSFDNSAIAPLKQSTLKRKSRLGQPLRVFEATGEMIKNSPIKTKISNYEYDIEMSPNRARIMSILQKGASPLKGSRRAFGLNKEILEEVGSLLEKI